jgi:23S rRNA (cytidine1920-2'-O)/16S rRNA (cytidine1409-2'-O)-methyltransferase
MKERIDKLLLERGLAESREKAQALILAGQVSVDGRCIEKAGELVQVDSSIHVKGPPIKYVGRGGLKLEAALKHFSIDPKSRLCLDIGASTGGFTDCLLQRGAGGVIAVDVGTNQLDWRLRSDSRVVSLENTNARYLNLENVGKCVDLIVVDVSFISLELILPVLPLFCKATTDLLLLVKPQFEVGKGQVGKGGVVRDPALHAQAVDKVKDAGRRCGFEVRGSVESPITGAEGNREFFLWLRSKS